MISEIMTRCGIRFELNPKNNNLDGKIKVLREMEKMHCTIGVLEEKNKHQQQMLRNLKAADFTLEEENRTLKSQDL